MKNSIVKIKYILLAILLCLFSGAVAGQMTAIQREALANQEFRWGVGSINAGQYTEAIVSFTRSLGFLTNNATIQKWLGHAYYASGYNDAAIEQWNIVNTDQRSALITSLIAILTSRKQQVLPVEQGTEYIDVAHIEGNIEQRIHRPTAVHANSDGSIYVSSMGSNRVLQLSADGTILQEYSGTINSVKTPFDLTTYKNYLFVTEIAQDTVMRIDLDTRQSIRFGSSGSGPGEFHGPQYISSDDEGSVYISDWGNKRICKYDLDGNFLFSFGDEPQRGFLGLQEPTGVMYHNQRVYVADRKSTGLHTFDRSGNYIEFIDLDIADVESVEMVLPETLLLIQNNRIFLVDIETRRILNTVGEATAFGLSSAVTDVNDHIIATDVERNELVAYAPFSSSVGGIFTRIEQIRHAEFPRVSVSMRLENALGNPIMGLSQENIFLFEEGKQIPHFTIDSASYLNTTTDFVVVIQADDYATSIERQLAQGIRAYLINDLDINVEQIAWGAETVLPMTVKNDDTFSGNNTLSQWKLDQTIRIAGNTLVQAGRIRRGILLVTQGDIGTGEHFQSINLTVTVQFLQNNGIQLHLLHLGDAPLSRELYYIANETGGTILTRPPISEGIRDIAEAQKNAPTGLYILRYTSDVVQREPIQYVPITTEIEYFVRSSRAESGFFLVP